MNQKEVADTLREFIRRELLDRPNYPLADGDALISGGLIDSFSLAQIGVFVEDTFGIYIPDTELTVANMDTIQQMVTRILEHSGPSAY